MEDTDEDFFDKLVDDVDDQFNLTSSSSTKGIANDSNEAKAKSNSSIDNGRNAVTELEKVGTEDNKASSTISSGLIDESTSSQVNPGQSLVSSSSFAYQNVHEQPNTATFMEERLDSTETQYHGTGVASGAKEVQWSAFTSDPQNSSNTFGSYSDFFTDFGDNTIHQSKGDNLVNNEANSYNNYSHQFQEGQSYTTSGRQSTEGQSQDPNTSEYWENLYPGWKYDTNTGQWYQVDESYDATTNTQATDTLSSASDWTVSSVKTEVAYLNQTTQLMAEKGTNESVTSWSPVSQTNESPSNNEYPSHMYFDPQYPGWYYDMNIQEWRSLDSYNSQVTAKSENRVDQFSSSNSYYGNEQQGSTAYQNVQNQYSSNFPVDNSVNQQQSYDYGNFNQSTTMEQSEMMNVGKGYGSQNQLTYSQQSVHQKSYGSTRSSAGQPPHALVTFGFGGKLIVMKDTSAGINSSYGGQESTIGSISVLNMAEIVTGGGDVASGGTRVCNYFHTLCRQSFPGPLAGGNVGGKELNRWIDERITQSQQPTDTNYKKNQVLKLLLSLLKIASQHYGKLRSPFGTDTTSKENDAPDVAVARLFASAKKDGAQYGDYGAFANCLQQLPSEGQIRATAAEVQTLLVYGRKIEALQRAQEGQLWGLALVLAAQLGDQFYVDCVRKMAVHQLVAGSPLRTLCLLIAGQPADVFSTDTTTDSASGGSVNMFQQPAQAQLGANAMLDDWEENLAMITANRTKDDELVLIHLGDCLWKETSNIIAAHICYLVAEANFEPYSDSARLCLIGADHWKHPRTYASPEAIQRTEVYEYSKLLGNSQFTLLPFQPYKLIYANMLAEVGRVSDSLKYCQVISKSLKTGRAPEVETWRHMVSSLEDRIKTYQQGGFSTNLVPGKLVGKLLNLFDSTAQRVVGGLPPPVPSTSGSTVQNEHHQQPAWPRVSASQSTMAMSSLVPSASMEPISQKSAEANRRIIHNRSVSEPDFGRSPRQDQVDSSKENSTDSQSKSSLTSRFGRFGFGSQLFQKTFSIVLKPRQDKQAKLGDKNKFYYDEKLKRWVEEGVDPPAEEAALAPPPTTAAFQNGTPDYATAKSAGKSEGSLSNGCSDFSSGTSTAAATTVGKSSGIPPIPASSSSQFSARGRVGVRARYVDTFNQGGGNNPTKSFQSPSAAPIKPTPKSNPKFFVPMAAAPSSEHHQPPDTSPQKTATIDEDQSPPFQTPTYQSSMQRFGSMEDLGKGGGGTPVFPNNSCSPRSRRTVSWGGSMDQRFCNNNQRGQNGEVLGVPRFVPSGPHSGGRGDGFMSDDLHEVQL